MPPPLADVLATENDFDLCNGLFQHLLAHHGEGFDPAAVPPEHRTVLLVWLTTSVIGRMWNGYADRALIQLEAILTRD